MLLDYISKRTNLPSKNQMGVQNALQQKQQSKRYFELVLHEVDDSQYAQNKKKYALIFKNQIQIQQFIKEVEKTQQALKRLRIDNYIILSNVMLCFLKMKVRISSFVKYLIKYVDQYPIFVLCFQESFIKISNVIIHRKDSQCFYFTIKWLEEQSKQLTKNIVSLSRTPDSLVISPSELQPINFPLKNQMSKYDANENLNPRDLIHKIVTQQYALKDKVSEIEQLYQDYFRMIDQAKLVLRTIKQDYQRQQLESMIQNIFE